MAGAEQIRLQQFEVASIAAPPALLCQQLLHTSSGQGDDALAQVLQNPALLLRVLDARYRLRDSQQSQSLTQRVERLDGEWLHAILSDMALQLVLRGAGGAKEIRIINTEIDRVAGILAGLREQQAQAPALAQDVDLNSLLRSMHKVFSQAYSAPPPVDIRPDLADGPVQVQGRADALKQIITNLVMNAAEALEHGGNIVLSTRRNVYQNGTLYLQLCVADDGPGMQPAQLATVFSAGNSTKGGDHTGSGLAIVKRLVDELAGQVSCQSDSKGTVIRILLPQQP